MAAGDSTDQKTELGAPSSGARTTADRRDDAAARLGEVIAGKYRLDAVVGRGGMGTVYRASHVELPRVYALKLIRRERGSDALAIERFRREAQQAAATRHPGIVEVIDFGTTNEGDAYMVMELLEGRGCDELVSRGPLDLGLTVDIAIGALDALAAAHERGLVHRDIKPENLFVVTGADGEERVKVLDFGIAKILAQAPETPSSSAGARLTGEGVFIGTPVYVSLEQVRDSGEVDTRADIYAVGATLYHLLTGTVPVEGSTLQAVMARILEGRVERDPRRLRADVPDWLAEIVMRAMARLPNQRYASAAEMRDALAARRPELLGSDRRQGPREIEGTSSEPPSSGARAAELGSTVIEDLSTSDTIDMSPSTSERAARTAIDTDPPPDVEKSLTARELDQQRQRRQLRALGVVAALATGAALALWIYWPVATSETSLPTTIAPRVSASATTSAAGTPPMRAPVGTVFIEGGAFTMGSHEAEIATARTKCSESGIDEDTCNKIERERPAREVRLSPYFIDVDEIDNARFARWLQGLGKLRTRPDGEAKMVFLDSTPLVLIDERLAGIEAAAGGFRAVPGQESTPVRYVTWHGARKFCEDHGRRLPTEAEWERAARGRERRTFPWGEESPSCEAVVFARSEQLACAAMPVGPAPVGSARGDVTSDGVRDLGGNVREWALDRMVAYPDCDGPCIDPGRHDATREASVRVIRGGGWAQPSFLSRAARRAGDEPGWADASVGFRCVVDGATRHAEPN